MAVTLSVLLVVPPAILKPVALAVRLNPLKVPAVAAPVILAEPADKALVTVKALKVGDEVVLIDCGRLNVTVPVPVVSVTVT